MAGLKELRKRLLALEAQAKQVNYPPIIFCPVTTRATIKPDPNILQQYADHSVLLGLIPAMLPADQWETLAMQYCGAQLRLHGTAYDLNAPNESTTPQRTPATATTTTTVVSTNPNIRR